MTKFTDFGLDARVMNNVTIAGYETPSPVQAEVIPVLMRGGDVMASAKTGTGKTAAFVLPMLHRLLSDEFRGQGIQILVLSPTRELAQQIEKEVKIFARGTTIRAGLIVGGVGYGGQHKMLKGNPQILVATPGRLMDHLGTRTVDLSGVQMVVLDEADRMLDMGFLQPVQKILAQAGGGARATTRIQMALLTATTTKAIDTFAKDVLHEPVVVSLAPKQHEHTQIEQSALRADSQKHKLAILNEILKQEEGQVIVFHATKHGADKLTSSLEAMGYAAAALHGGMKQGARKRTLGELHTGKVRILVATDVAARGIDVRDLALVVNFDMPQVAEDYVHRIGRTGRAGATGKAISLVQFEDVPMVRAIEKILGKPMRLESMEGFEPEMAWEEFLEKGEAAPKSRRGKGGGGGRSAGGARSSSGAPKRDFSASSKRAAYGDKKPYAPRPSRDGERSERPARAEGGYQGKSSSGSYGEKKSFGAKPARSGAGYQGKSSASGTASSGKTWGAAKPSRDGERAPARAEGGYKGKSSAGASSGAGGKTWGGKPSRTSSAGAKTFGKAPARSSRPAPRSR